MPKPGLQPEEVWFCVWNMKYITNHDVLNCNESILNDILINWKRYTSLCKEKKETIILHLIVFKGTLLLHDNTRLLVIKSMQQKKIGISLPSLYISNLVLSDNHLFRALTHYDGPVRINLVSKVRKLNIE